MDKLQSSLGTQHRSAEAAMEGMNHCNVMSTHDGMPAVLRRVALNGADLDLRVIPEHLALAAAAQRNIPCPELYYVSSDSTEILLEYLDGANISDTYGQRSLLPEWSVIELGRIMGSLHKSGTAGLEEYEHAVAPLDDCPAFFYAIMSFYQRLIDSYKPRLTPLFEDLGISDVAFYDLAQRQPVSSCRSFCLCHCDVHRKNLIVRKSSQRLFLIDWELALVGDPCYDIAIHLQKMRYLPEQEALFLSSYFDKLRPSNVETALHDIKAYRNIETVKYAYTDLIRLVETALAGTLDPGDDAILRYETKLKAAYSVLGIQNSSPSATAIESIVRTYCSSIEVR